MGTAWSFAPFVVVLVVCVAFLACRLPETSGRPIEEIVNSFRNPKAGYIRYCTRYAWSTGDRWSFGKWPLAGWARMKTW